MQVVYRMCDIPSTNPPPWNVDKFNLNRICLQSFVEGYKDIKPKVHFICDHCPMEEYEEMIHNVCPFEKVVEFTAIGINETMLMAYDIAEDANDIVLLQECDYLHKSSIGFLMADAIDSLGLVSPYDHLNFYLDHSIHSEDTTIRLVRDHHFRTTERNTMTWGCHSSLIKAHRDMLNKYGYLDNIVWKELRDLGYKLWTPIPSLATHMVEGFMAPGVDWKTIWKNSL